MKSILKYSLFLVLLFSFIQCDKKECTDIYAPVCGEDGRSYLNVCLARAAGNLTFREGICTYRELATVRFYGDQEKSQCTWILEIEEDDTQIISRWYTPELPDVLKVESKQVSVHFVPNDISYSCLLDGQEQLIILMDLIGIEAD